MLSKKQADVDEAKQRVEGGESWSKVAKELSDDPASKDQGGKLLGVTKGQQDPKLDAAVFAAVPKKVAGPIKTDAGYYVFRVTQGHQGLQAEPRAVPAGHPPAARLTEPAEGARPVLQDLPQRLARPHRLRERLHDRGLPQRP